MNGVNNDAAALIIRATFRGTSATLALPPGAPAAAVLPALLAARPELAATRLVGRTHLSSPDG